MINIDDPCLFFFFLLSMLSFNVSFIVLRFYLSLLPSFLSVAEYFLKYCVFFYALLL